ncbi:MAG: hypothetical protein RSG77_22965 [Hafnia sp.]
MPEEMEIAHLDERAGATLIIDDGCDWVAWLVWNMNSRRRISEKVFALPPFRPQVSKPACVRKNKKSQRKNIKATDF